MVATCTNPHTTVSKSVKDFMIFWHIQHWTKHKWMNALADAKSCGRYNLHTPKLSSPSNSQIQIHQTPIAWFQHSCWRSTNRLKVSTNACIYYFSNGQQVHRKGPQHQTNDNKKHKARIKAKERSWSCKGILGINIVLMWISQHVCT